MTRRAVLKRACFDAAAATTVVVSTGLGRSAAQPLHRYRDITTRVFGDAAAWPAEFPFTAADFSRLDDRDDAAFYQQPRFTYHVDARAVRALTRLYADLLRPPGLAVLDVSASHVSYMPPAYERAAVGVGMSARELAGNPHLRAYRVVDLNRREARLPFDDGAFDAVTCNLSVDYFTRPLAVFAEIARVLRRPRASGGATLGTQRPFVCITFSNRCFFSKAVAHWTAAADVDRIDAVGQYLHFCCGGERRCFAEPPTALELVPPRSGGDPLYAVIACRE